MNKSTLLSSLIKTIDKKKPFIFNRKAKKNNPTPELLLYNLIQTCAQELIDLCDQDPSLDLYKAMERLEEEHRFLNLDDAIIQQAKVLDWVRLQATPLHP